MSVKTDEDQWRVKCHESLARVGRLEKALRAERGKVGRLCSFINKELPALRDIVVQLTAKMDSKVEQCLLRDYRLRV